MVIGDITKMSLEELQDTLEKLQERLMRCKDGTDLAKDTITLMIEVSREIANRPLFCQTCQENVKYYIDDVTKRCSQCGGTLGYTEG